MTRTVLLLVAISLHSGAASAQELVWGTGEKNIQVRGAAAVCTLFVRTTARGETLPAEWRIVWAGFSDAAKAFSRQDDGSVQGVATVCEVRPAVSDPSPDYSRKSVNAKTSA